MATTCQPKKIERFFIGLTGYYKRFIRGFGCISRPLHDLLKKGNFHGNIEASHAFEALKLAITTTPVLALPNFSSVFVMEIDTFGKGIEAVLAQSISSIAFFSQGLSEKN